MNVAKAAARQDRLVRTDALRMLATDPIDGARRGGYVLVDSVAPTVVLIASGDAIAVALKALATLAAHDVAARVVAILCPTLFDCQTAAYRSTVLLKDVRRIAIEAGPSKGWWKYVGSDGAVVGIRPVQSSEGAERIDASADRVAEVALFLTRTEI